VIDGGFNQQRAHLLICDSNQSKHGSLMNRLASQFSMENNQRPKNVTSAADTLSNHKHNRRPCREETVSERRAGMFLKEGMETKHHP
jgi:hypothetical protein